MDKYELIDIVKIKILTGGALYAYKRCYRSVV